MASTLRLLKTSSSVLLLKKSSSFGGGHLKNALVPSSITPARCLTFGATHDEIRATTQKVIEKDIAPFVDEWEEACDMPSKELFKKLGNAGLLGIHRDPEYGGLGLDYGHSIAFFEELGKIEAAGPTTAITVHTDMALPALVRFGSDYLKRNYLVPAIAGDYLACVGVSEISGGSDVAALKTTAKREGDDLVINGMKMWISNGAQADFMTMLANTSEGPVHKNKSLIIVPMKTPGVHVARRIEKMGLHSSDTAEIYFDNVRVPAKNIIGEEGMGFMYQMMQFQDERLCAAASAVESMNLIIQGTIEYCRQRHTFDMPLIDNQYIHFKLAELQADVECLRSVVYRAADGYMEGDDMTYLATIAKLKAGRLTRVVSDSCLQFFGGMGYTKELPISRAYRDSRVLSIAGGADEIMLGILCAMMGILPKKKRKANEGKE
ncbi:hypothetical protein TYRP_012803 [Tyrophagus putrescentiae]|nr:hypothetical protein TYRP_012803 [Tyrophagus putrescentiae]